MEDAGHPLDNPIWGSLHGAHAPLAEVASVDDGWGGRYQTDVCPFGAVADVHDPACWTALASTLHGRATSLLADEGAVPEGWDVVASIPSVQMDGTGVAGADDPEAVALTGADVPEMLELVERARPGPYLRRTVEMGRYLGIRRDGRLVAMGGERLHPPGWTEISAVCTDDRHRGSGLATRLVRAVAAGVQARGEVPFLHAAAGNLDAIRLYEALGFSLRRRCSFTIVKPPAPG